MAPKIFTLLRCPVTGTSGGQPTRLQVACRVESWRKLASSVKINAQFCRCAFFYGWDRCTAASDLAGKRRPEPARDAGAARRSPNDGATCVRGPDDNECRIPPR